MAADFKIVVSADNSSYLAWQTQLFCFSALTRFGKHPVVVVHRTGGPLRREFEVVRGWGCKILDAPPYGEHPVGRYPARNELGSLLTIAAHPDFETGDVLFCEPDMLFVRRPRYPGGLCGQYYRYLDYAQPRIGRLAGKFGVAERVAARRADLMIGVPYLIPGSLLPRLARRWIEVLDAFDDLTWIDIMYAFGLALAVEDLPVTTTRLMAHNLEALDAADCSIIHYCYGDRRWDKRLFRDGRSPLDPAEAVPPVQGLSGSILGEIYKQIRQARACAVFPPVANLWRLAAKLPG